MGRACKDRGALMRKLCFCLLCLCSCLGATELRGDSIQDERQIVKNILENCKGTGLSTHEVSQVVHFIETQLFNYVFEGNFYINKNLVGLSCDIEYDHLVDLIFIHLNSSVSGKSKKKILKKAIQYDVENPRVVAIITSTQCDSLKSEINIVRQLQPIKGVIPLISAPAHMQEELNIQEMIIPFYAKGDLKRLVKTKFSLREKISFAVDLMQILEGIHSQGIIHDDIHTGNLILEDNRDLSLHVRYRLVLIDFEKARAIGDSSYLINRDLYCAGCTLYCLLNAKAYDKAIYRKVDYLQPFCENPQKDCLDKFILGEISKDISRERRELSKKRLKDMTVEEKFAWTVLQMLHPTCKRKADASYWRVEYKKLLEEKKR